MAARAREIETFTHRAELAAAVVKPIKEFSEAAAYVAELCLSRPPRELLGTGEGPLEGASDGRAQQPVVAAPGLSAEQYQSLVTVCDGRGIRVIHEDLRGYLSGIDIGFTIADFGIAETGTLVLDSSREAIRLATMVSEVHLALLPCSRLVATAFDIEDELNASFLRSPSYISFITGASRTADIERVLTLGVHGPLELHILLWEGH